MRTEFRAFEAECDDCGHRFFNPELGDASYGEFIFTTTDARHRVYCDALDTGPQVIHGLMGDASPDCFQEALAFFADPVANSRFTSSLRCPNCTGLRLERCTSEGFEALNIPTATYSTILDLPRDELATQIAEFITKWRA